MSNEVKLDARQHASALVLGNAGVLGRMVLGLISGGSVSKSLNGSKLTSDAVETMVMANVVNIVKKHPMKGDPYAQR